MKLRILILLLVITNAWAQTGTVQGRVVDQDGRGIPTAGVRLLLAGRSVASDSNGYFVFANVTGGLDSLRAGGVGYNPTSQAVVVTEGTTIVVNVVLQQAEIVAWEDIVQTGPWPSHTSKGRGTIVGRVFDREDGSGIPFAVISIKYDYHDSLYTWHRVCCLSTQADSLGTYAAHNLDPAHYELVAHDRNRRYAFTLRDTVVRADSVYTIDFELVKDSAKK